MFTSFAILISFVFSLCVCSNFCCLLFRLLPLHMFATVSVAVSVSLSVWMSAKRWKKSTSTIKSNRTAKERRHWVRTNPQTSTVESQLCAGATRKEISEPTATATSTLAQIQRYKSRSGPSRSGAPERIATCSKRRPRLQREFKVRAKFVYVS